MCNLGSSFMHVPWYVGARKRPTTGYQVKESIHKADYEALLFLLFFPPRLILKMWLQTLPHTLSAHIHHTCLLPLATKTFTKAAVGGEIIHDYYFLLYTFLYFYIVYNKWVLLNLLLFPLGYNTYSLFKKIFFYKRKIEKSLEKKIKTIRNPTRKKVTKLHHFQAGSQQALSSKQFAVLFLERVYIACTLMSDGKPTQLVTAVLLQAENIVLLELDMPSRTTRDYEGPAIAPKVQAALDAALQDEDEIQVDASSFESTANKKSKAR